MCHGCAASKSLPSTLIKLEGSYPCQGDERCQCASCLQLCSFFNVFFPFCTRTKFFCFMPCIKSNLNTKFLMFCHRSHGIQNVVFQAGTVAHMCKVMPKPTETCKVSLSVQRSFGWGQWKLKKNYYRTIFLC